MYPYFRDSSTERPAVVVGTAIAQLATVLVAAVLALSGLIRWTPKNPDIQKSKKVIPAMVSAALFSLGLKVSGMTVSSKIYGFLNVKGMRDGSWDPTLACVMGGGLLVSFLSYQWVKGFNIVKVCVMSLSSFAEWRVVLSNVSLLLLCETKECQGPRMPNYRKVFWWSLQHSI
jgi:hypothetical protein